MHADVCVRLRVWIICLVACAGRIHDQGVDVITVADRSAGAAVDLGCGDPLRGGSPEGLRFVAWQPSCFERGGEQTAAVASSPASPESPESDAGQGERRPTQTARR